MPNKRVPGKDENPLLTGKDCSIIKAPEAGLAAYHAI